MKCPLDNEQLIIKESRGNMGYKCNNCQGVFLTGQYVRAFEQNYLSKALKNLENQVENPTKNKKCPACQNKLIISFTENIEIDCCSSCGGIWFDAEELEDLISKTGKKQNTTNSALLDLILTFIPFPFGDGSC